MGSAHCSERRDQGEVPSSAPQGGTTLRWGKQNGREMGSPLECSGQLSEGLAPPGTDQSTVCTPSFLQAHVAPGGFRSPVWHRFQFVNVSSETW